MTAQLDQQARNTLAAADIVHDGFNLHYETLGPPDGRVLMLIAGSGEQIGSVEFPDEQCRIFAERGFHIVCMDNRDAGLSTPTISSRYSTTLGSNVCISSVLRWAASSQRQIKGAELWNDAKMGHIMHREQGHELADRIDRLARTAGP